MGISIKQVAASERIIEKTFEPLTLESLKEKIELFEDAYKAFIETPDSYKCQNELRKTAESLKLDLFKMLSEPQKFFTQASWYTSWSWYLAPLHTLEEQIDALVSVKGTVTSAEILRTLERSHALLENEIEQNPSWIQATYEVAKSTLSTYVYGTNPSLVDLYHKVRENSHTQQDLEDMVDRYPQLKGFDKLTTLGEMTAFLHNTILLPDEFFFPIEDSENDLSIWQQASSQLKSTLVSDGNSPLVNLFHKVSENKDYQKDLEELMIRYPQLKGMEKLATTAEMSKFLDTRLFSNVMFHPIEFPDDCTDTLPHLNTPIFWKAAADALELDLISYVNTAKSFGQLSIEFTQTLEVARPSTTLEEETNLLIENVALTSSEKWIEKMFGIKGLLTPEVRADLLSKADGKERYQAYVQAMLDGIDANTELSWISKIGAKIVAMIVPYMTWYVLSQTVPLMIQSALNSLPKDQTNISTAPIHALNRILEQTLQDKANGTEIDVGESGLSHWGLLMNNSFSKAILNHVVAFTASSIIQNPFVNQSIVELLSGLKEMNLEDILIENGANERPTLTIDQQPFIALTNNVLTLADSIAYPDGRWVDLGREKIVSEISKGMALAYQEKVNEPFVRNILRKALASVNQNMKVVSAPKEASSPQIVTTAQVDEKIDAYIDHAKDDAIEILTKPIHLRINEFVSVAEQAFLSDTSYIEVMDQLVHEEKWDEAAELHKTLLDNISKLLATIDTYEESDEGVRKINRLSERLLEIMRPLSTALIARNSENVHTHLNALLSYYDHFKMHLKEIKDNNTPKPAYLKTAAQMLNPRNLPVVRTIYANELKRIKALASIHNDEQMIKSLINRTTLLLLR